MIIILEMITFEEADISSLNSTKSLDILEMTNGDKNAKKEGKNTNFPHHYMKSKPYSRRTSSLLDIFRASTSALGISSGMFTERHAMPFFDYKYEN